MAEDTETEVVKEAEAPVPTNLGQLLRDKAQALASADITYSKMRSGKKFNRADVMKVLGNLRQVVRIHEQLSDLTIKDLMIVDQRFSNLEQQLFQMVQQVSTISTTLMNKQVISKDDIKDTWEKEIKPQLEAKIAAARAEMEGPPPTPPEPASSLVGPDGTPLDPNVPVFSDP
jgi:hypothetical protein